MNNKPDSPILKPGEIEAVVDQVKHGETESFQFLVEHFQRQLHVYCFHMLGNSEEAKDAVQDIFIKSYENLQRYHRKTSFSAWLYKIAYYHCLNLLKKRKGWQRLLSIYYSRQVNEEKSTGYSGRIDGLLDRLTPEERQYSVVKSGGRAQLWKLE
ncbi:RNA polymerase sigma factor [Paenibacillus sp. J2TS4]|uniref:RNA polymerase sigma factor n=1 Tax=Paenibacillus sp. J2TS4 TaxID=2807194 RepID=UPI001B26BF74|nr:sigma-70 family RNA polymerase sigma factor [Paenibacillus sp. J2TS4]GIP31255.1 hypothetical protein J2TS4_04650 [Paenibacillus sp. J2TS4]